MTLTERVADNLIRKTNPLGAYAGGSTLSDLKARGMEKPYLEWADELIKLVRENPETLDSVEYKSALKDNFQSVYGDKT